MKAKTGKSVGKADKPAPKPKAAKKAPKKAAAAKKAPKKAAAAVKGKAIAKKSAKSAKKTGASAKAAVRKFIVQSVTKNARYVSKKATGLNVQELEDDEIWIVSDGAEAAHPEDVPYTLVDGDVIWCYNPADDPNDPATEPEIESFEVDCDEDGTLYEDVIVYDCDEDYLEVDLSILDQFEEFYDPEDTTYECSDADFGIGIEG